MRTVRRLRLRCFSFDIYSDVLSTLLIFALSKLCRPIKKTFPSIQCLVITFPNTAFAASATTGCWLLGLWIKILLVDLGGFAPPSRTLFARLHTAITFIYWFLQTQSDFLHWVDQVHLICASYIE